MSGKDWHFFIGANRNRMRCHSTRRPALRRVSRAFTLIELLVVIAIISLLVSILLPSLSRAKELAREVVCASSLHRIGIAVLLYNQDHDSAFPPSSKGYYLVLSQAWCSVLLPYMDVGDISYQSTSYRYGDLGCPTGRAVLRPHYGGSAGPFISWVDGAGNPRPARRQDDLHEPGTLIMMLDASVDEIGYDGFSPVHLVFSPSPLGWRFNLDYDGDNVPDSNSGVFGASHCFAYNCAAPKTHRNGSNVAMCDGHVERMEFLTWCDMENGFWTD